MVNNFLKKCQQANWFTRGTPGKTGEPSQVRTQVNQVFDKNDLCKFTPRDIMGNRTRDWRLVGAKSWVSDHQRLKVKQRDQTVSKDPTETITAPELPCCRATCFQKQLHPRLREGKDVTKTIHLGHQRISNKTKSQREGWADQSC